MSAPFVVVAAWLIAAGDPAGNPADTPNAPRDVNVGGEKIGVVSGGATDFDFKQGFWTQADLGGFFRVGGFSNAGGVPSVPVTTSQTQPYIGIAAGYDIFTWLGVQASVGTGFVANAATFTGANVPRDYGITSVDVGATLSGYLPAPLDRLAIAVKPSVGATMLTPPPDAGGPQVGGNAGLGIGLRYATLLPNTFVGLDCNTLYLLIPARGSVIPMGLGPIANSDVPGVLAFSFAPVIKYVF